MLRVVTNVVNKKLQSLLQKLLNELFVLTVASAELGAELVLAGAELVNLGVKLVDSDTKLSNNRPKLIIAR